MSFSAAGIIKAPGVEAAAVGAAGEGVGAGAAAGVEIMTSSATAALGASACAPTIPSVSIVAINWSLRTAAPSGCSMLASTPSAGAGISRTILSVSISIRISSALTGSPTFFFHSIRLASETDSDSSGTLTSTIDISFFSEFFTKQRLNYFV